MSLRNKARLFLIIFLFGFFGSSLFAQDDSSKDKNFQKENSGTYVKTELIRGNFDLYGNNYRFNDFWIGIEHYMARNRLTISGFSFGYKKEDFSSSNYGHFVNGKLFWKFKTRWFDFKPGVGMEWGKPSPRFEHTNFKYSGDKLVSYERVYLERNANVPFDIKSTGLAGLFFETGLSRKAGPMMFEGGARFGINGFVVNEFYFSDDGNLDFQSSKKERNLIPVLYIGVGIKIF
ncbi:MAG: hypothetical protein A2915_04035 [Candidatus Yanofskybacteria bacterium RIFCSPLOWO2_01_FULL_41_34]|uniref:Outer membrane protein beta-barrel domain-containing protein n=1 Tax=Candidatus Yanofskybacteria bacterium RIFCSPHIGHO2_01_FULL_41_26 TaxID=1802661 RepID=A0A1F8EDT9_9BACT|nr:MAG: hypothetical protein A2649_03130 [Candidatus Yanofskybacteria bacterium RIFCSPHIGHO2_01_FULL_41_26]OGN21579.1 MAG: hypothetical protein A2915_04035 [Candidatus Yanofskybacteria bacterium RIFCSPLOWO2_01_FULL_41_34]